MKTCLCILVGAAFGYFGAYGVDRHRSMLAAQSLIEAAARADGLEGGITIRHAVIGGITNVTIGPDRVMVYGLKGSRGWFN